MSLLNKLDSLHDLSNGEREYIKSLGLTTQEFDNLDPVSQREWKEECRDGAYEKNRKELKFFSQAIK